MTTHQETSPDPELQHFSIAPARQYVLPRVREAFAINPRLESDDQPLERAGLDEDDAQPDQGPAVAAILSRFRDLSRADGSGIWRARVFRSSMLTIQNEPNFEPENYPGSGSILRNAPRSSAASLARLSSHSGSRLKFSTGTIIGTIPRCRLACSLILSPGNMSLASPGIATKAMSRPKHRFTMPILTKMPGSPNARAAIGRPSSATCSHG